VFAAGLEINGNARCASSRPQDTNLYSTPSWSMAHAHERLHLQIPRGTIELRRAAMPARQPRHACSGAPKSGMRIA
jgi:hypothetical protein